MAAPSLSVPLSVSSARSLVSSLSWKSLPAPTVARLGSCSLAKASLCLRSVQKVELVVGTGPRAPNINSRAVQADDVAVYTRRDALSPHARLRDPDPGRWLHAPASLPRQRRSALERMVVAALPLVDRCRG